MPPRSQWYLLCIAYVALRAFSFFFWPPTPLYVGHTLNDLLGFILFGLVLASFVKHENRAWLYSERGWYLVAGEFILGGAGGFIAYGGIALRTWLLLASIGAYVANKIARKEFWEFLKAEKNVIVPLSLLYVVVLVGSVLGLAHGHSSAAIVSDALPYFFLLYYFPLKELLRGKPFIDFAQRALAVAVIGNAVFTIATLGGFSSGAFPMQGTYYHWFRDVALGKITELPLHYFRLVLNEHLLLAPLAVFYVWKIIKRDGQRLEVVVLTALLAILAVNLTRIYLLALVAGLVILFTRQQWRRWLRVLATVGFGFCLLFTSLHLAASRGSSLGWELFGLRIQSIVAPHIEDSSLSRLLLLPKIIAKIKQAPMFGAGLADAVTVFSPVFKQEVTTPHFDWGYLEIIAELGLCGLCVWLLFLSRVIKKVALCTRPAWQHGALGALLIINITSPALFHVMGTALLAVLLL